MSSTRSKVLELKKPSSTVKSQITGDDDDDDEDEDNDAPTVSSIGGVPAAASDTRVLGNPTETEAFADSDLVEGAHLLLNAGGEIEDEDDDEHVENDEAVVGDAGAGAGSGGDADGGMNGCIFRSALEAVRNDGLFFGEDDDGNLIGSDSAAQVESLTQSAETVMMREAVARDRLTSGQLASMAQQFHDIDPSAAANLTPEEAVAEAIMNHRTVKGNIDYALDTDSDQPGNAAAAGASSAPSQSGSILSS